jgi:hypothetical protein
MTTYNNLSLITPNHDESEEELPKKVNKYENLFDDEEDEIAYKNKPSIMPGEQIELKTIKKADEDYNNKISEPNDNDNLFDIIYKLKHNTDLNVLVKTINKILINDGKQCFDKTDMTISLKAEELDKFSEAKDVNKNFDVIICYALNESI